MNPNNPPNGQQTSPYPENYGQQPQTPLPSPLAGQNQNPNPVVPMVQTGMFKGRLNRIGYLLACVYNLAYFLIPIAIVFLARGNTAAGVVSIILDVIGVAFAIPLSISIQIRRWHDLNRSGWFMLLALIPFAGIVLAIIYLAIPGTKTANKYGAIDDRPSSPRKVLFGR